MRASIAAIGLRSSVVLLAGAIAVGPSRAQDGAPQSGGGPAPGPAAAGGSDESTPSTQPTPGVPTGADLTVPRAERGDTGTEPTEAAAPSEAAVAGPPRLLMRALGIQDSPVQLYGWIQNNFTGNANGTPRNGTNFGVYPNHLANRWQGNQYYFIVENPIESGDRVNLGFRYDVLFGNDWQFTKDYGLFDRAFQPNHFVGVDFPQIYGALHLPWLTRGGVDFKGGRWYSPCGYEGVQAIQRPLLSVPYTLNFTPFTFFGLLGTLHLTDQVDLLSGTVNGWDRWINRDYKWGYIGGLTWTSKDSSTSFNSVFIVGPDQLPRFEAQNTPFTPTGVTPPPFLASRRNLGYGGNDRLCWSTVLTHQWNKKLTEALQTDQVFDANTPGFGPGGTNHNTEWYSLVHWFLYELHPKALGVWRAEVFRDNNGAATGVADTFYEMTLGLKLTPRPWLWLRPEARYDWAKSSHPFNDGTRSSQLTLAIDMIVLF
jgi:hypothetical protein